MATPDDEHRTLGPPPGARRRTTRDLDLDREPRPGGPPPTPAGPPPAASAPPPRAPALPRPPEPPQESYETIPPVPGIGRRKVVPGPPVDPPRPLQPWGAVDEPAPAPPPAGEALHPGWTMGGPAPAVGNPWAEPEIPPPPAVPSSPPAEPEMNSAVPTRVAPREDAHPPDLGAFPAPPPRPPAAAPRMPAPAPPRPSPSPAPSRPVVEDLSNRTMAIDRVFPAMKNPLLTLQFYNTNLRRWSDLGAVRGSFLDLGRATFQDWNPNPEDLAESHVRLMIDEGRLFVEPLPSLNGVYLKMKPNRPAELAPGARFRIGRHVIAFRKGDAAPSDVEPLQSADGEVFQSRVLVPLGFLDLIGPDGEAYVSHPLTKTEDPGTRIGRGGARCDLALTGDDWVSGEHARVYFTGEACFLEDLKSTNGTFIQVVGMQEIERGVAIRPDAGDIVAIGGYMIRVVEERP
ncbi:FHA domain-containing protein [Paludisphaera mucosa]|uniref:FHA domain-containing protein n=1 Tax=Paludisphaera mucosa TaxID=3030827 RepID=A0ABT6FDY8_9BACT|nr:FHA domain-containing protein [Paludisphaera mucosa]MDG3005797.1 FHA domain-containing protein [Paludisphaera mucosa]